MRRGAYLASGLSLKILAPTASKENNKMYIIGLMDAQSPVNKFIFRRDKDANITIFSSRALKRRKGLNYTKL